jgi:RND family efflux transporter MFP subunit
VAQAQANLDRLQRGPSAAQLTAAEVQLEQARINLERARQDLEKATLHAPFAGVITAVHVSEGETAGGAAVEMVDTGSLEVVLSVDEVDIANLEPGQPATVTLEGWPERPLEGLVAAISPCAVDDDSTVATFEVFLRFDQPDDLPLLVGMTADAAMQTAVSDNILLVPNAAINVDRSVGTYSVNRVNTDANGDQSFEEVEVTIGLRDSDYTQILSGLEEGDAVFVGTLPTVPDFGPGGGFGPGDGGPDNGPFGG